MKIEKRLYLRTLSLLMSKTPKMIIYSIVLTVACTIFPYVNIIISSALIDKLIIRNFKMLLNYAGLLVISDFVVAVMISFLQKKMTRESERFLTFQTSLLSEHAACISYERFCGKEYQNQRRKLDELSEETGANLSSVVDLVKRIIASVVSIIVAGITIIKGFTDFLEGGTELSKITLIGMLMINVILIIISISSSWRIQRCKECADEEILPNYKINWYLDREYLRFKKTAKEIRIFKQEKKILGLFANANNEINRIKERYDRTVLRESIVTNTAKQLSDLAITVIYGLIAILGNITIGGFNMLSQMTRNLYDNIIGFSIILVDYKRIGNWLSVFWDYYDIERNGFESHSNQGDKNANDLILFNNVGFKYNDLSDFSIDDLNLTIKRGEHIAIVGQNGSGKSTLVMLMCGLLTPTNGNVSIFGDWPSPKLFATVFQDYNLFALPINEKISASCSPNRNKIVDAMKMAGIPERLISEQEMYLYKQLDPNGIEVSGGEKQKIAIARAFYKESDIIIMDEPTASMDPISEAMIYEKIHSSFKDKTVLFVSHRLSSCKFCDRILVMEQGNVVQEGMHDLLIDDQNGRYYKLWNAQAQYYQT